MTDSTDRVHSRLKQGPVPSARRARRALPAARCPPRAARCATPTAPRAPADVPGFDAANPRRSAPASVLAAREVAARETAVAVERAKLLRESVVACYRAEGVNHLERCGARVRAYLEAIENVGAHRINAGERDR